MKAKRSKRKVQNYNVKRKATTAFISFMLFVVALHFALYTLRLNEAHAEVSFSTFPTTLTLRAQPPGEAKSSFTVENKGEESIKLNIQLKPFKADQAQDGKVVFLEGSEPPILKNVEIVDDGFAVKSIELGPKQTKNLSLRIKLSQNEPTADHYFSIVFLTEQPQAQSEAGSDLTASSYAQAGIALNVLLAVGPKELPHGYLEEFSTSLYRDSGPVPFTVKVRNGGTHYMTPQGVILIKNFFGQTVGRMDLHSANILVGTSRSLVGTPYSTSANKNQQKITNFTSPIVWPEKFLLGMYTADLSLALSEEGPVFNQSIRFIAIPGRFLLGFLAILIIILLIIIRVRRKLRES